MQKIIKKFIIFIILAAAIAFVVFAGLSFTKARTRLIEVEKRAELKQHAETAASIISPNLAAILTFTDADRNTPYFESIRQQLTSYRKNINVRGIYTMSFRDGNIFFGPETYDKDDPMASPPGTKYEHPAQENFDIFQTGKAYVFGPYTDEYGSFITAIAPVKDTSTGNIIMSVGIDIAAALWYRQLSGIMKIPLIIIFAVIIIFILAAFLALQYSKIIKAGKGKLRLWIILPVSFAMLFIVVIFSLHEYNQGIRLLGIEAEYTKRLVENKWSKTIERQVRNLHYHAEDIAKNSQIIDLWKSKDIDSLYVLTLPKFELLREDSKITHFYFIDHNNACLLRVHAPSKRGDIIDRHTMLMAQKSRKPSWGIETGPLGTFTLRYVRPLEEEENIWGYLELGMEIEYLKDELAEFFNTNLLMLLDKNKTTREKFYAGKEVFDFPGEWEDLEEFVLLGYTVKELPKALADLLFSERLADTLKGNIFRITGENKSFLCSAVDIYDVAGESSAVLLVVKDITNDIEDARAEAMFNISIALATILGIIALLWFVSSKAEEQLDNTFNALRDSEEKALVTLNSIGDAVIATDTKGKITRMNPVAESLTGWPFEQARGMELQYVFNIINSKTRKTIPNLVSRVMEQAESIAMANHTSLISRDGREYQIAGSAAPIKAKEGHIIGVIVVFHDVTNRYKAQEELRYSQERFAIATRGTGMAVWDYYVREDKLEWDDTMFELFGVNKKAFKNKFEDFARHVLPEELSRVEKEFQQALDGQKDFDTEFPIIKPDGSLRYMAGLASVLRDEKGSPVRVVGINYDITERKDTENKLLQLSIAVEQNPACIVVTDTEGNIKYVNPKFVELTGYSSQEAIGQNPRVLKSGEQPDSYYKELWQTITAGREWRGEFRNKKKNGQFYWERALISPIEDKEGRITGFIGIKEDITDYKLAQEKLRETAYRYKTLVENVPGIVYRCVNDAKWTMFFISDEIKRLTGYPASDFINNALRDFASIIYPDDKDRVNNMIQQALLEKKPYTIEYRIVCADTHIIWVQERGKGVFDPTGNVLWLDGVITDITLLKQAEEQMKLTMEMQIEFTSTVSHELRTPLTAIKEGIAIVLDGSAGGINDEQKDFLDTAKRNVDRLTRLINDVLDFQKLKSGKAQFNIKSCNLNEAIVDVHKQMMPEAKKKGLDFILKLDRSIPDIKFDHDAIMRVVINLVNNAFKFTDKGSVTITTEQRPDENLVYTKVIDTGPGIKDSDLGRLFEDFQQLEKGKDRKTGGTGLGLAISKRIIGQHGGKIWAESEAGKGASFIFVLPIVERRGYRG